MKHKIAVALVLLLAGCASGEAGTSPNPSSIKIYQVELPDGRVVDCVVFEAYRKGGITCDWD